MQVLTGSVENSENGIMAVGARECCLVEADSLPPEQKLERASAFPRMGCISLNLQRYT